MTLQASASVAAAMAGGRSFLLVVFAFVALFPHLAIPRVTAMYTASCIAMAVATAELRLQLPV